MRYLLRFLVLLALALMMQCGEVDLCDNVDCDDQNDCTEDVCNAADGLCSSQAVQEGTACDFGQYPGECLSGVCVGLCEGVDCDDQIDCTEDLCNQADGTCSNIDLPDGAQCAFNGFLGVCESGVCLDAELCRDIDCRDGNDCTDDVCNPMDGSCSNPNKVDGASCEIDGETGECLQGVCTPAGPINRPPTAKLTAYPLLGEVPRTVDFDASGSTDPDGDSLRYSWKILDGGDPVVTTTPDWSHRFDQAGDYDVLLTVFDTHDASAIASAAVSFAPPALKNADFEEALEGLPVGWSTGEWRPDSDFAWEPNTGRGGSGAVRITTDSSTPNDAWWYQPVQLTPNTPYNLSGWISGENITDGGAGANLGVLNTWIKSYNAGSTGTFGWQQLWVTFETDAQGLVPGAAGPIDPSIAIRLGFWASTVSGTAWYDDLRLTADDFAPPLSSKHLSFNLERTDLDRATPETLDRWLQHLDASYEAYNDLVGDVPYDGQLQRVLSVRQYPGGWAVAGNPIRWMEEYIGTEIGRVHSDDDWSFGILHEISHGFDLDYRWVFQAEFSANFKLYYVVTTLNGRVRFAGTLYEGIALRDPYEEIHQEAVATNSYNWNAMTFRFILLAEQLGWGTFQQTYRAFSALDPADVPTTQSDKLEAFLAELSAQSGTDVEMLIPAVELSWMRANL
ncbi:MAG: PKD domain-containing protein [Polyangiales bacterium]